MKNLIQFLLFINLVFTSFSSWGQQVTFTPFGTSPFWFGEQTTFALGYRVGSSSVITPFCSARSASVVGNSGAIATLTSGLDAVTVTWGSGKTIGPQHAKVTIQLGSCDNSLFNGSFTSLNSYQVMSIAGETPSLISGESTIPICESGARLYSISPMQIPNGVNRAASGYEWTIPSGWKFSDGTVSNGSPRLFTSANAFSQSFTPNCSNTTGSVSVRAWTNAEGRGTPHYSNPRVLPITRTPEFVITTPSEVRCGVAFIASVPDLPCVSPSSYVWNLPPGWTMSGSGRTRVIIPSGSTSQTISADIILAGGCVVSTSKSITPLNSGTISGPPTETICVSGNTYTLDNPPTNSTISWTVTPANRVVIASGTGSTAFLIPGSNPGPATLKFTVSGNCNYEVSKFVYSGALQSSDISIQPFDEVGGYPYVCPNGIYVANIGPFNPNYAYEIQVTNGYATPYNNSTTPNSFVININNYTPSQFVDASISARVNNGCGWSAWKTINLYSDPVSCPPGSGCELCLLLAPNPSSHEVMISLDGVEEYEQKTGKKLDEGMFFIYDLDGNLRKSGKIVGKTTVLVNDLPVGQYVVYYQNGKIITQKNLKIEK